MKFLGLTWELTFEKSNKIVTQPTSQRWVNPGNLQNEPLNSQSDFVWFANLSDSMSSKSAIRRKIISEIFREISIESFEKRST